MTDDRNTKILLFVAGVSLGAAAGLLWAPRSGAETRKKLASQAHVGRELFDKTREFYEAGIHLAEEAAEMFEEGRKLVRG